MVPDDSCDLVLVDVDPNVSVPAFYFIIFFCILAPMQRESAWVGGSPQEKQ